MHKEFLAFLKQYSVVGLAIAVVIGGKANALVTSVVDGIIMPIVTTFLPSGGWRTAPWEPFGPGSVKFLPGPVLAAGLDFVIVALFVFLFAKLILKEEVVVKK